MTIRVYASGIFLPTGKNRKSTEYESYTLNVTLPTYYHVRRDFVHIRINSLFSLTPSPTRLTLPNRASDSPI